MSSQPTSFYALGAIDGKPSQRTDDLHNPSMAERDQARRRAKTDLRATMQAAWHSICRHSTKILAAGALTLSAVPIAYVAVNAEPASKSNVRQFEDAGHTVVLRNNKYVPAQPRAVKPAPKKNTFG